MSEVLHAFEEPPELPRASPGSLRRLWADGSVRLGSIVILVVVVVALAAPLVAHLLGHGATEQFRDTALSDDGTPVGPSAAFPLGADGDGRDVLVRVLYGTRISLLVGIPATSIAMVIGTIFGLLAGFFGGRTDRAISQIVDIALSFPFVVTALSLLVLNRHGDGSPILNPALVVILVIALFSWTYFARLVRGIAAGLRHMPFVEAAEVSGAGRWRLLWKEILPNVLPAVVVYWAVQLPLNIVAESTLSFLGVGIQPPQASLGNMIADAEQSSLYQIQPWYLLGPAILLFLTVLGFNALGAGLRNVLDPHGR